jgi:hypothetical protein
MSKVFAAVAMLLSLSSAARAEEKEAPVMEWEAACAPDVKALCQEEIKNKAPDVRPCLAKHEKELSKECTKHFSAAGFRVAQLCGDDINRLCAAAAAKGELGPCMNAKQDKLSPKCKEALMSGSKKEEEKQAVAKERAAERKAKKAAKKAK